jgi:hypothetical protein
MKGNPIKASTNHQVKQMSQRIKSSNKALKRNLLASAISMCLPCSLLAANFTVSEQYDDGTGNVVNTLSWAIAQANTTPGDDTIILDTDVISDGVMTRLIDSNVTIQSADSNNRHYINGNASHRPLFIKSGTVTLQNINIDNGLAKGGDSGVGAPGAGLGGALFIYDGNVSIHNVDFNNSITRGGDDLSGTYTRGGGGMLGHAGDFSGGGLFASGNGNYGGYGGNGNYQNQAPDFGTGGDYTGNIPAQNGGFGGGGGWPSGHGGFGGGGADTTGNNVAGNGGFGAGAVYAGSYGSNSGVPGFGASYSASAGMGGAIFVRTGQVHISNSNFNSNSALADNGARGLGGGVFVLHSTTNSNGNDQGMPAQLASVTGCGNSFTNNFASGSSGVPDDDNDIFDIGGLAEDLTQLCPVQQNLVVTVSSDNGLGDTENTLSWAIKESNAIPGDDTITLATDVTITGVMKRLIDSNVTIQSDGTRRTISGNDQFRPLFIKSGQVTLNGFDVINGLAQGGRGFTGGAGMGGSLFIYAGDVAINNLSFSDSLASGGINNASSEGGGGMFGNANDGGGGLFAAASGNTGGHGGFYGNFGRGGDAGVSGDDGFFGGGGGGGSLATLGAGEGGFGAGGGGGAASGGRGGFGGGADGIPGFGATLHGAGMGGAVFIRSGDVTINNTEFNNNEAQATDGASGLGGSLFILHSTVNGDGFPSQQGMPSTLATVSGCGNSFSNNSATHDAGTANNSNDLFDIGGRIGGFPLDFPCSGSLHLKVTEPIDDGTGDLPNTLSWAINASNSIPGNDAITFETDVVLTSQSSSPPIWGHTGTPTINGQVKIIGNSHTLERDDSLGCSINNSVASSEFRLLHVGEIGALEMNNMVLRNGCADWSSETRGGAILNQGNLAVNGVTFVNNQAQFGGAVNNRSPLNNNIIQNSTFNGNIATINSGLAANGGAISNEGSLQAIINNTFYQNAAINGGAIESFSANASIDLIANNLFTGNSGVSADCFMINGGSAQGSNNISDQDSDACGIIDDMTLTAGTVSPLADNGCAEPNINGNCVLTHALTFSSEAIDGGDINATIVDQRGLLADGPRDMGAFEFGATISDVVFKDGFE